MLSRLSERGNGLKTCFRAFFKNMKFLYLSFWLVVLLGSLNVKEVFSQKSTNGKQIQIADWSGLFPEIPNCEREIQPIKQNGEVLEQVAIYERENYKNNKGENYFGCGSITLRFEPHPK